MAGLLFIILGCTLWAFDSLVRYPLVEKGIDPTVIVFLEHAFLTLVCLPRLFVGARQVGELRVSEVVSFLIVGGLGSAFATVCFTQSFLYLNPSLVILLQKFQPVIAVTLAALILKEAVPRPFIIWSSIGLIGALLVSAPDLVRIWELMQVDPARLASEGAVRGYSLVGLSIVGWAAATVFGKKLSMAGFEPGTIMGGRFFVGLVTLCFLVPWGPSFVFKDMTDYGRLLALAVAGGLAMAAYYQGVKRLPAKLVSICELFFPFMAVILNWFVLGKMLNEIQLAGGALLAISALVLQLKKY